MAGLLHAGYSAPPYYYNFHSVFLKVFTARTDQAYSPFDNTPENRIH